MSQALKTLMDPLSKMLMLGIGSFILAMAVTPIYTFFAYRLKFWKQMRHQALSGGGTPVYNKIHAEKHKRNIPTMAGIIFVVTTAIVSLIFNFSREQTWLPLTALVGCALVGLVDDFINIRSHGKGIAGMRAPVKFAMITLIGLGLGWFFYSKLGVHAIHVPFVGAWESGLSRSSPLRWWRPVMRSISRTGWTDWRVGWLHRRSLPMP